MQQYLTRQTTIQAYSLSALQVGGHGDQECIHGMHGHPIPKASQ